MVLMGSKSEDDLEKIYEWGAFCVLFEARPGTAWLCITNITQTYKEIETQHIGSLVFDRKQQWRPRAYTSVEYACMLPAKLTGVANTWLPCVTIL